MEDTQESVEEVKEEKSLIEQTDEKIKVLKEENDRFEKIVERQEKAYMNSQLGGKSDAGQVPEEPKEESAAEYVKKIMDGGVDE